MEECTEKKVERLQAELAKNIEANQAFEHFVSKLTIDFKNLEKKFTTLTKNYEKLSTENALLKKENELLVQKNKTLIETPTQPTEICQQMITGEELEAVASEGSTQGGYQYDHSLGMYRIQDSHLFYDAEKSMFYDPNSGSYYSYDQDTQEYSFYSMASSSQAKLFRHLLSRQNMEKHATKKKKKKIMGEDCAVNGDLNNEVAAGNEEKKSNIHVNKAEDNDNKSLEDGEVLSNEEEEEEEDEDDDDDDDDDDADKNIELLERYIPCVRMIVKQSSCLKVNSLFIVTCKFSMEIGRDVLNKVHYICIEDPFISKSHCKIEYSDQRYHVVDLDSKGGVFINGVKVKQRQQLRHQDSLSVCGHDFELHIHPQSDTCAGCEPGLLSASYDEGLSGAAGSGCDHTTDVINTTTANNSNNNIIINNNNSNNKSNVASDGSPAPETKKKPHKNILEDMRKLQLKKIKKKYGLENFHVVGNSATSKSAVAYKDRAERRRGLVGSEPPMETTEHAGDDAVSSAIDGPLPSSNTGFRLLKKMGWKEGEGLGKISHGITQPIQVKVKNNMAGLGSDAGSKKESGKKSKSHRWMEAKKRYEEIR